jgi:hypothetical protein
MATYMRKINRVEKDSRGKLIVSSTVLTDSELNLIMPFSPCKTKTNVEVFHTPHGIIRVSKIISL